MGLMVAVGAATVISVTTVLETVAVVGAVLSVAGMVTKNKTLSMVGAGLGLVGGIGALASGALGGSAALFGAGEAGGGEAASAGSAFGGAASDASNAATYGATAAFDTGNAAGAGAGTAITTAAGDVAAQTPDIISTLANAPATAEAPVVNAASSPNIATAEEMGSGFRTAASTEPLPTDLTTGAATSQTTTSAAPTTTGTINNVSGLPPTGAAPTPGSVTLANGSVVEPGGILPGDTPIPPEPPLGGAPSEPSMLSNILKYAGQHPVVAMGALQAGGSLLSGMFSSVTPAQAAYYNSEAAKNQAAANLTAMQTANLQAPKAIATSAPVTGTPKELVPGYTGLINQAGAPRPNVTGAVV